MSRSRSSSQSKRKSKERRSSSNHKERKRSRSNDSKRYEKDTENNCLYIGNLDKRCSEDQLKKICLSFGQYEYCYIVFEPTSHHDRNQQAKISRGYGFVKYKQYSNALKARDELNGKQIMSRKINVEISRRTRPRQSTPGQYLGRRRSPPRRQVSRYRRRSYSRQSSNDRHRRNDRERKSRHRDGQRDRERDRKRRDRSRSGEKKHRRRESHSP